MKLEEFMRETFSEDFIREADAQYDLYRVSAKCRQIADESPYSRRELAKRMGVSKTTINRLIFSENSPRLATLSKLAHACGYELEINFVKKE